MARMYVPECFVGLASTWLLFEIFRAPRRSAIWEAAYVCSILAGLSTEWFFWFLTFGQILIVLLHFQAAPAGMRRLLYLQSFAIVLGGYTVTQAFLTHGEAGSGGPISWDAIQRFLAFGYLTEADSWSIPQRAFPNWFLTTATILSIILLVRGLTVQSTLPTPRDTESPLSGPLLTAALGMSVIMAGLTLRPGTRPLVLLAVFPFAVLAALAITKFAGPRLSALRSRLDKWVPLARSLFAPITVLAIVPVSLVFLVSVLQPIVVSRALLVFVPYLLVLIAAGVHSFSGRTVVFFPLIIALAGFLVATCLYFRAFPSSPIDYQTIATVINSQIEPGDVIVVPQRKWYFTPLFYYLDASRLIGGDYSQTISQLAPSRAWAVQMRETYLGPEIASALRGYKIIRETSVKGDRVFLMIRAAP